MPREILHWKVLEKAQSHLRERGDAPSVLDSLETERAAAYLGALTHDAPYYYKFGGDAFQEAAEYLHGSPGNDTLLPLLIACSEIQKKSNKEEKRLLFAFVLGMLSHAVSDWNFHPFVFYFTGNYNHPVPEARREARRRHRLLETYLDTWFREGTRFWNDYLLLSSMRDLGPRLDTVCKLLDAVMVPECLEYHGRGEGVDREFIAQLRVRSVEGRWRASISYLVYLQYSFLSPSLGAVAHLLKTLIPSLAQNEVLFSRGRLQPLPRFSMPFQFQNPVSGESRTVDVNTLFDEASKECAEFFARFEPLVAGSDEDVFSLFKGSEGKSLNFGIPKAAVEKAKHFSSVGLDMPGLSIEEEESNGI